MGTCRHILVHMLTGAWVARQLTLHKKATIHQETTRLATSKNVLFSGHNHLLTTVTDDLTL